MEVFIMILGDTYEYTLSGRRTMDQDVPFPAGPVDTDTMRVWTSDEDREAVYVAAGHGMRCYARRQGILIEDSRESWYALADALRGRRKTA